MEKLVYLIHRDRSTPGDVLRQSLIERVVPELRRAGAERISVNVDDSDVAAGERVRISHTDPPIRAMLSFWMENSDDRGPCELVLSGEAESLAGYSVVESRPLVHDPEPGRRSRGVNLVTRIHKLSRISDAEFVERWTVEHRRVALETQSTFAYVRNAVVRTLLSGTPNCDGIVEESFPIEALTDPHVWYDCNDAAEYQRRLSRMMDSVTAFLEMAPLESIPMSEYRFE